MNNSPYLDRPLLPLAVALPRMLEKIEADLATTGPAETRRLRQRAEVIRALLAPSGSPTPPRLNAGPPARVTLLRWWMAWPAAVARGALGASPPFPDHWRRSAGAVERGGARNALGVVPGRPIMYQNRRFSAAHGALGIPAIPLHPSAKPPVSIWVPMLSSVAKTVTWSFLMDPWAPARPSVPGHRSIVAENLKIW
jgi:hypothetical protein